jgi:hypothetical protein
VIVACVFGIVLVAGCRSVAAVLDGHNEFGTSEPGRGDWALR